ncbi:MAG: DUF2723 domain-containing protein [Muribaculaceae bacterium]|nr:DUF2723 domain-containing protein [Muribaculaceae bacterium]
MLTKRYNLINNIGGWFVFLIALITYWLTLEPTASYWDCGEFIIQAARLEVGHPPGNPIFMLTARFFANFAPDAAHISVMVNAMSGLLSALTILLLFWTITHLVRRLVVKDGQTSELSLQQYLAIMGAGLCGSLAYCWSDTFWFSAVEGEVYAFSSFCTALVFWLILKWENRADQPHSDRYLILIAYIIGVSVAVHLLNLLCIPAIVLVFAYRKYNDMNVKKSLIALLISFAIVVLVLYGLVPGFIKMAQQFELLFVNGFHMSYNSGALFYAFFTAAVFIWALYELYRQKSAALIRSSFLGAIAISGIFCFGNGFLIWWLLMAALAVVLFFTKFGRHLPVRVMTIVMWSIAVIFVGYSSYALILIRSSAETPMNQNAPDNVFDLASYLNREQYGENPLLYGETLYSSPQKKIEGIAIDTITVREDGSPVVLATPYYNPIINPGKPLYAKGVKGADPKSEYKFLSPGEMASNHALAQRDGDYYVKRDYKPEAKMNPELNMLFPRIYSRQHRQYYGNWVNLDTMPDQLVQVSAVDESGNKVPELDLSKDPSYNEYTGTLAYQPKYAFKPSFFQNLAYFFNYQLNHMYLRYFMWNFAGRQNDINNQAGEKDAGNWISGIPFIDNPRLGDQSLLPPDLGTENKGHNVYYMLPLLLGLFGLIWQSFAGRRGIEQFWVVFFLFFMTGIAIVLYLNQPPNQPRERDYAFAGSFYAYAIWIGMGVPALWRFLLYCLDPDKKKRQPLRQEPLQSPAMTEEPARLGKFSRYAAAVAFIIGIAVPLQMVSQTWDDHDRSHRFAARDYAINYLNSLEPNAIVFCNGDNDTFPLWYAQEVEGVRPDVRIINLSYLNSDWYANQMRRQAYDSAPVDFTATPADYAYGRADVTVLGRESAPADLLASIKGVYAGKNVAENGYPMFPSGVVRIPVDKKAVIARGLVAPQDTADIVDYIDVNLRNTATYQAKGYLSLGELLMLDIVATNAANGWKRPIYWVTTVGDDYHVGLTPYMRSTGMAHQLVPTMKDGLPPRTDRAYEVVKNYRWGGADAKDGKVPYFDETARRMLLTTRSTMVDVASELIYDGDVRDKNQPAKRKKDYEKALEVANLIDKNLPEVTAPYGGSIAASLGQVYGELGQKSRLNDKKLTDKGLQILWNLMERTAPYLAYNREIAMSFGNASLTYESRYAPYQFYRYIELYEKYGGSRKKVDELVSRYGMTVDDLKKNYDLVYGGGYASDADYASGTADLATIEKYAEEIARYAEIVNELAPLSPEEYAARSDEERLVDSMFMSALDFYYGQGGDEALLKKYENFNKVDMSRSRRIDKEFSANHPELKR